MPKAQPKRMRGKRGRERPATRAQANPVNDEVEQDEMVNLLDVTDGEGNGDGKSPIPVKNVVDFEAFMREAGLIDANSNNGCGGEARTLSPRMVVPSHVDRSAGIEPLPLFSDDVYVHIPMCLRQQIWRGEYLNLALLLKGAVESSQYCSPNTLRVTANGTLEAGPRICRESISSIESWTDAFLIFMAIVVVQNPSKSTELIRYMTIIREASQTHASNSWIVYDSQFRLRQAVHPGSWARMNQELWSRFMKQQEPEVVVQTVPNRSFPSAAQSSAMGKCHDFNNGH